MGSITMNVRIGRNAMSHRMKDGKMQPYIRGYDIMYVERNVIDQPDWDAIHDVIDASNNPRNVELCFQFVLDCTNNTS